MAHVLPSEARKEARSLGDPTEQGDLQRQQNDEYCRTWNRLPLERRKGIVEQADAVATELKALNLTLRRLREAGASQHAEFLLGEQRSHDLDRIHGQKPLLLGENFEAIVGKTLFNSPPPDG